MAFIVLSSDASTSDSISIYRDDGSTKRVSSYSSVYVTEEIPVDENVYNVDVMFDITKSTDEGLVSGWASIAVQPDGSLPLDWQGDVIKTDTLEKAAINFMKEYRESGVMHEGEPQGVVVESIVFTKEKQEILGIPEGCVPEGWFITVKVNNSDVFKDVKTGKYKMFSIQGKAKRYEL